MTIEDYKKSAIPKAPTRELREVTDISFYAGVLGALIVLNIKEGRVEKEGEFNLRTALHDYVPGLERVKE
jgi:hypothetical protein